MSLSTDIPSFDLFEKMPVYLVAKNCTGLRCAPVWDYVSVVAIRSNYVFTLRLVAPQSAFGSTLISTINQLKEMRGSSFAIESKEFRRGQFEYLFTTGRNLASIEFSDQIRGSKMLERDDDENCYYSFHQYSLM